MLLATLKPLPLRRGSQRNLRTKPNHLDCGYVATKTAKRGRLLGRGCFGLGHWLLATQQQIPSANATVKMMSIPENAETLLTRSDTATALTEAGYPVKSATLATRATRGGGPPYRLFGRIPLYRWGDSLAWAQSRLSDPVRNTSESSVKAAA